jgi:type II secretory pathway component PulF
MGSILNNDEFAFFNQQLAAMLRDGVPLEGALQRLCAEMRAGKLRTELELLQADLARGTPLSDAVRARRLPDLYRYLLEVGAKSQNLPGVLTLVADYYQRKHNLWTRLKGLLVYPAIVLCASFVLSCFLSYILNRLVWPNLASITNGAVPPGIKVLMWLSPLIFGVATALLLVCLATPMLRRALRWRVPAFRESSLAEVASAMTLLLRAGVPLDHALALIERLEESSAAGTEIGLWRQSLASGNGKFASLAKPGRAFPPLFVWIVSQSGDNLAEGFQKAAEIYQSRANYSRELLLYSALPCSVLALGLVIMVQIQPVFATLIRFMNMIGDAGS